MMYKKGKDYFSSFVSGLVSSFLRPNKPFFSAGLFSEDSVAACCTRSRGVSTELIAAHYLSQNYRYHIHLLQLQYGLQYHQWL